MIQFIIGLLIGGAIGVFAMSMCIAAKWSDRSDDQG